MAHIHPLPFLCSAMSCCCCCSTCCHRRCRRSSSYLAVAFASSPVPSRDTAVWSLHSRGVFKCVLSILSRAFPCTDSDRLITHLIAKAKLVRPCVLSTVVWPNGLIGGFSLLLAHKVGSVCRRRVWFACWSVVWAHFEWVVELWGLCTFCNVVRVCARHGGEYWKLHGDEGKWSLGVLKWRFRQLQCIVVMSATVMLLNCDLEWEGL